MCRCQSGASASSTISIASSGQLALAIRLVFEGRWNPTGAADARVAQLVQFEQFRCQGMAARMALALFRIDPDDENAAFAHATTPGGFRKVQ